MTETQVDLRDKVQALLQSEPASQVDALEIEASTERGFVASARQGEVENLEHHREQSVNVTVYRQQRSGSAATSDLSESALAETLAKAISIAHYAEPDPYAGLADKAMMATDYPDLELNQPWDLSPKQAIELAITCDEAARAFDPRITQTEEASVSTNQHYKVYANSHGFIGDYTSTMHGCSISVVAADNQQMERDYDYHYARAAKTLVSPQRLAETAADKALKRLNARKITTRQCPVIFAPRAAKTLLAHLINAISGSALYRQSSFLLDHLDKKIFPDFITINQQPHLLGELGSMPFDGQGVITADRDYIHDGVLSSYVLGSYSARKLGMTTTGNAGGVFNLSISHNNLDFEALCQQMHTGLVVTELMGQGINLLTGDYSRGAAGFWVEHGEIQYPVHEITIAANLRDMYANLAAVANDTDTRSNIRTGSILLEQMTIAGD